MEAWALAHEARPDAKAARADRPTSAASAGPDGDVDDERVVVFTEYRDTQQLARRRCCASEGWTPATGVAAATAAWTTTSASSCGWRSRPTRTEHPVRILLATDAASEGIDLQRHCHRLVNYDIPFNPNRLEQRIGRIDRYGQRSRRRHPPLRRHRLGPTPSTPSRPTWSSSPGWRGRSRTMRDDLGSVNAVLADAVQRRMLGEQVTLDVERGRRRPGADVPVETDVPRAGPPAARAARRDGRQSWASPRRGCERVVDTALELARQRPLRPHLDDRHVDDRLFDVPPLTGSWHRATAGLAEKLETADRAPRSGR